MAVARAGAACPTAAAAWKKAAISSKVVSGAMREPAASSSAWMRSIMSLAGRRWSREAALQSEEYRIQNTEYPYRIQMWGTCDANVFSGFGRTLEYRIQNTEFCDLYSSWHELYVHTALEYSSTSEYKRSEYRCILYCAIHVPLVERARVPQVGRVHALCALLHRPAPPITCPCRLVVRRA